MARAGIPADAERMTRAGALAVGGGRPGFAGRRDLSGLLRALSSSSGALSGAMLGMRYLQARFISIWGLLIAAFLCPPEAFAAFAIYSAMANALALAAMLRFEAVFFQNSGVRRLGQAVRLSLATGCGFMLATAAIATALTVADVIEPGPALLFLLSLAGRAGMRLLVAEATAENDFQPIGNSGIVQAVVQPVLMLALILGFGASAEVLFAADAFGHLATALYLWSRRRESLRRLVGQRGWSWRQLRLSAWRWRIAPGFFLPSALLSFGFAVTPLLMLPLASSAVLAAQVALAMRLLDVPTQMFGAVSVPLAMGNLRRVQGHARRRRVRLLTLGLVATAAGLFLAIAGASFLLDCFLAGTRWRGVGAIMAILCTFFAGIALVNPLSEIGTLASDPRHAMIANAAGILAMVAAALWFRELSVGLLWSFGAISLARMAVQARLAWIGGGIDLGKRKRVPAS